MNAFIFPGQGSQYSGMGKDLYEESQIARDLFHKANDILNFDIVSIMFEGSDDDLMQTKVTQPAVFLHSVITAVTMGKSFCPDMVAGHSLGEISALTAAMAISFEEGLTLVLKRALAMQKACEATPSSMAAIIGLNAKDIEDTCKNIDNVVTANYNSPSQLAISGTDEGINKAIEIFKNMGAKRVIKLAVGGAFHSPFMEPAKKELEEAIKNTNVVKPVCPVYQNVTALPTSDPATIRNNLTAQLTSPVKWTQTVVNMINDGASSFVEVGPGNVLRGLVRRIDKTVSVS